MLSYFFYKINSKFIVGKSFSGGRNLFGRVCVKGRGGINKRYLRLVNFYKRLNCFGLLCKIIYDSNRTAPIICVLYDNGFCSYDILIEGLKVGSKFYSGYLLNKEENNFNIGWCIPILNIKLFSIISCLEIYPFLGSQIARAAGCCAILIGKFRNKGIIKLTSGWILHVSLDCFTSCGKVSKNLNNREIFNKAGKMRAFGFKPKVRGVAKNPCDHPHGGGNGKKSKPTIPVNAWGRFAKWSSTKNSKKDFLKKRLFKNLN